MQMNQIISITALTTISALGTSPEAVWNAYKKERHFLTVKPFENKDAWVSEISAAARIEIASLQAEETKYKSLDQSVLYALYASRKALEISKWGGTADFGVNIGSSRGATALFEQHYKTFLEAGKAATLASPTTTLGNISSWVAHDLKSKGPTISHSITCSTALHALLNGIAWLQSGMCDKFLVGGCEAPLTSFTIAQMQALKIYAELESRVEANKNDKTIEEEYPCRAMDLGKKRNTMVLGEGAAMACLELGRKKHSLAVIEGVGYATEPLTHNISISTDAQCFQDSMKMALGVLEPDEIDVIVMHAPGTIKGDLAENRAIEKVFANKTPALTTNKWKLGHTFGASGMLSLELGVLMLQHQEFIGVPFISNAEIPQKINKVLINAVGFGGNAVSVIVSI